MQETPRATLKPDREKSLRRRHPWVFSGAVSRVEGDPAPGATVRLVANSGEFLAWAAYSPSSQIRLRCWSFDEREVIDAAFFRRRLEAAIGLRQRLGLLDADGACRLVFSESDGLPGLIVDRYRDHLVCQFLSAGSEHWRDAIVAALGELLAPAGIHERSEAGARRKEGFSAKRGLIAGSEPGGPVEIVDYGLRLLVDVSGGQKTGTYLDQGRNRKRVAAYAEGASVLDAYSYSGGFALAALQHGAAAALLIDSSADALAAAERNAGLNGCAEHCSYLGGNVPEALRKLRDADRRFGLIVLDPPKFVHSDRQLKSGSRGYKDINLMAMKLLAPGGILATFSCSGHVSADLFQKIVAGAAVDARRDLQILERLTQGVDHPVGLQFPEGEYLKGLILRVGD